MVFPFIKQTTSFCGTSTIIFDFMVGQVLIFIIITILILTSKIKIQINNVKIDSRKEKSNIIDKSYKISIKLCILNRIPIFRYEITQKKISKLKENKKIIERIDTQKENVLRNSIKIDKEDLKQILHQFNINLKKLCLDIELGTENAVITALLVPVISTALSFLLKNFNIKKDESYYFVKPQYFNQNFIKLSLECIFTIKMIHIIYIYVISKKGKVKVEK